MGANKSAFNKLVFYEKSFSENLVGFENVNYFKFII